MIRTKEVVNEKKVGWKEHENEKKRRSKKKN